MISKRSLTLLASIWLIQSCSSSTNSFNQVEQIQPATIGHTQLTKKKTQTAQFIMRGTLVIGHEAQTFTPCGSNRQYWVNLKKPDINSVQALSSMPYQPMYAELIGRLSPPSNSGFDSNFTAIFNVSNINMVSTENPQRCTMPYRSTQAFGNEPFWLIDFTKNQTSYSQTDFKKGLSITSSQLTTQKRQYQFERGQLSLTKKRCNDTMSNSVYGWTSEYKAKDNSKSGCATLSNIDSTLTWLGTYQANSTKSNHFSVSLELEQDHRAATYYRYSNGEAERRETGYWQQINPTQIQVVMTNYQGQRLIAERIFNKNGQSIRAEKEKINNKLYHIADNGLILYKTH